MNLILLGPPGSGKGTQSSKLVEKYKLSHISTGDILRSQVSEKTKLGVAAKVYMDKGDLVPDKLIIDMVSSTTKSLQSILLDGFPRTIPQADGLSKIFQSLNQDIDAIINIEVDKDVLIRRLVERAKNSGRADDTEEVIKNRQNVYLAVSYTHLTLPTSFEV